MATALVNRPAIGVLPDQHWPQLVRESLMSVAPPGMHSVFTAMCGTCAVENSFKVREIGVYPPFFFFFFFFFWFGDALCHTHPRANAHRFFLFRYFCVGIYFSQAAMMWKKVRSSNRVVF